MQVRVLPFGVLKDWLGSAEATVELPEGSTVAELLRHIRSNQSLQPGLWQGIAVSVNAEYATVTHVLRQGDEVGLLPPVSGGSGEADLSFISAPGCVSAVSLSRQPIDSERLIATIKRGEDGAVVVFDGIVRDNSRGRKTLHLDYEAYEEMADSQMGKLAAEALQAFGIRQVVIVHRLGRLHIGETSVLIVVASAHRAAAFEACRWLIDTLKKTVPIWKKETFVDGAVWAAGEPFPAQMAVIPSEPADEK
ncbi:MAG: molybdenum cofactor biosynthesis protein MoaE [Terracidiphilus sp.]|jgi:molybdopterin synthase catalytic subunit